LNVILIASDAFQQNCQTGLSASEKAHLPELDNGKWMDAATASAPRLEDHHAPSRASEFAGNHQARGAGADNDDVFCL
jgi:hypothetical protein